MTILESQFEEVADAIDAGKVLHHEYDLKNNILMKVALATIPDPREGVFSYYAENPP